MASIYTLLLNNLAKVTRKCFSLWKKKQGKGTNNVFSAQNLSGKMNNGIPIRCMRGNPTGEEPTCISRGCHRKALEPGSIRLTWSASRKHRCQALSCLEAGSLCSRRSTGDTEHADEARAAPDPPDWLSSWLAKAGHAGSQCNEVPE